MAGYETGNRAFVLRQMAECAIRDRQDMLDGLTDEYGRNNFAGSRVIIEQTKQEIRDFKKLSKIQI